MSDLSKAVRNSRSSSDSPTINMPGVKDQRYDLQMDAVNSSCPNHIKSCSENINIGEMRMNEMANTILALYKYTPQISNELSPIA